MNKTFLSNLNSFPILFDDAVDPSKVFVYRSPNGFITKLDSLSLDCAEQFIKCDSDEVDSKNLDLNPIKLNDDVNFKAFYKIDKTFKIPKNYIYLNILTSLLKSGPEDYLHYSIISNYLKLTIDFLLLEPIGAGNFVDVDWSENGIQIVINSYKDITSKIVRVVLDTVFNSTFTSRDYLEMLQYTIEKLNEYSTSEPLMKNHVYFKRIVKYNVNSYSEILRAIDESPPTFEQLLLSYKTIKENSMLTMLIFGDVEKEDAKSYASQVHSYTSKLATVHDSEFYDISKSIKYHRKIEKPVSFFIKNENVNEIDNLVTNFYQVGVVDSTNLGYSKLMSKCIGEVFYYNLRTIRQLGYIAGGEFMNLDEVLYFAITVQGTKKSPLEAYKIINEVILIAESKIEECKGQKLEQLSADIINPVTYPDLSLYSRSASVWSNITLTKNKQINSQHLSEVKFSSLSKFYKDLFYNKANLLSIMNYNSNEPMNLSNSEVPYELNPTLNVTFTNDFDVLKNNTLI
jgi:secreted Zn-dependent insulinase-like peptidase